jgi:Ca-activated chloride channel family protein
VSFGNPLLLLTLLALPVAIALYVLAERRRMRYAVRFTNVDVLASVVRGRMWRLYIPPLVFLLALATLSLALARPRVERLVAQERATVILVVDDSRSMQARDVKPTRLAAAQAAVRTFIDHAPDRLRIGLVVFSGEAHVATPPTTDHDLVRQSLDELGRFRGFGGTAIGDALAAAVTLGERALGESGTDDSAQTIAYRSAAPAPARDDTLASILFLSDGAQTRGLLQPLEGAELAKEAGIPVYTIALGTPGGTVTGRFGFGGGGGFGTPGFPTPPGQGGGGGGGGLRTIPVPPDPATLRAIAQTTGGEFSEARSAESLEAAYAKLGSSLGRAPGEVEVTNAFVAGAAALLLAAALLSALWSPRLP